MKPGFANFCNYAAGYEDYKKKNRLLVLHWFPVEKFPPAQNFLKEAGKTASLEVVACTTEGLGQEYYFSSDGVEIRRSLFPYRGIHFIRRLVRFALFPLMCVFQAARFRPDIVMYYEPHSALAAFCVLTCFRKARLLIHYHEYRQLSHYYDRGNFLARVGFWLERRFLFRRASWVSHTNRERCEMFLSDCPEVRREVLHELPNYPPSEWCAIAAGIPRLHSETVRFVYVGAISLRDTYLHELVGWLSGLNEKSATLDLYISSIDAESEAFLQGHAASWLNIHFGGVAYTELPRILPLYDVGLILYRCNTVNYVYNAPNKLFEYLACGLNVLYPSQMLGVRPYDSPDGNPWVRSCDFSNLSKLSLKHLVDRRKHRNQLTVNCDDVYQQLLCTLF